MNPSFAYGNLHGPPGSYPQNRPPVNQNFSTVNIRNQIPYDSLFFNTMVAAAANGLAIPNMISSHNPAAAVYNSVHQNAAYNPYYFQTQQQYSVNMNMQAQQTSAFQSTGNTSAFLYQQNLPKESTASSSARRTKKRPPSEVPDKGDLRRREDFNALARARTDQLLHDKSLFTPLTVNDSMANGSSTSSCNSLNSDQMSATKALESKTRDLLNAILDERIRQLLLSPSIAESLRAKQAAINRRMRSEETFEAKMRKSGALPPSVDVSATRC